MLGLEALSISGEDLIINLLDYPLQHIYWPAHCSSFVHTLEKMMIFIYRLFPPDLWPFGLMNRGQIIFVFMHCIFLSSGNSKSVFRIVISPDKLLTSGVVFAHFFLLACPCKIYRTVPSGCSFFVLLHSLTVSFTWKSWCAKSRSFLWSFQIFVLVLFLLCITIDGNVFEWPSSDSRIFGLILTILLVLTVHLFDILLYKIVGLLLRIIFSWRLNRNLGRTILLAFLEADVIFDEEMYELSFVIFWKVAKLDSFLLA